MASVATKIEVWCLLVNSNYEPISHSQNFCFFVSQHVTDLQRAVHADNSKRLKDIHLDELRVKRRRSKNCQSSFETITSQAIFKEEFENAPSLRSDSSFKALGVLDEERLLVVVPGSAYLPPLTRQKSKCEIKAPITPSSSFEFGIGAFSIS